MTMTFDPTDLLWSLSCNVLCSHFLNFCFIFSYRGDRNNRCTSRCLTMNPEYSLQDVVNCQLCESNSHLHCDICQIGLCKQCVGTHIVDGSKMHKVVPYNKRASSPYYPKCYKHSNKQCVLHCEHCDIPLCVQCISSNKHNSHISTDINCSGM